MATHWLVRFSIALFLLQGAVAWAQVINDFSQRGNGAIQSVPTTITPADLPEAVKNRQSIESPLNFQIEEPGEQNRRDLELLQSEGVFANLNRFLKENFYFAEPFTIVLHHGDGPYFNPTNREIVVPYSFFDEANIIITSKYPQQDTVQQRLFVATVEQMLWHEIARALVTEFSLPLLGREEINIDFFVTLMILNIHQINDDYILDAVEDYLLIDNALVVLNDDRFKSELEFDLHRYRVMACTILGKDNEEYPELVEEMAWDQVRLNQCQKQYETKLHEWISVLSPFLKETSPMKVWLPQSTVDSAVLESP